MAKFNAWLEAEIRSVYYEETRRGATPRAWNRASGLARREQQREHALRQQIRQQKGVEPEDLLRDWLNKK